jgi:hypothetical protein
MAYRYLHNNRLKLIDASAPMQVAALILKVERLLCLLPPSGHPTVD